jgi:O-antigen ligase
MATRLAITADRSDVDAGRLFADFTLVFLLVALVLGGATRGDSLSSAALQLLSLPLLAVSVWRLAKTHQSTSARVAMVLVSAGIALPLIQLVPLPANIWSRLPGREFLIADYRSAGMILPWLPISLTPHETAAALPWLAPAVAVFLATLTLNAGQRRRIVLAIPLFALLAVALGMMQVVGGPESRLRFYTVTNVNSAVGFFANRNHQASLLIAALAFTPLWITAFRHADRQVGNFGFAMAIAVELVLMVGIGVSRSRAGVILAIPAILGGVLIVFDPRGGRLSRSSGLALLAAALIGATLVGLFASSAIVARFQTPMRADLRQQAMPAIEQAAKAYLPLGSGLGSFDRVYQMNEPIGAVSNVYLNHAHDDFLELWLETGVFGAVLVGALLIWWVWVTLGLWRPGRYPFGDGVRAAASLVIGLLLAHSLVDYPLRTTAMSVIFGLACGILAAPNDPVRGANEVRDSEPEDFTARSPDSLKFGPVDDDWRRPRAEFQRRA